MQTANMTAQAASTPIPVTEKIEKMQIMGLVLQISFQLVTIYALCLEFGHY